MDTKSFTCNHKIPVHIVQPPRQGSGIFLMRKQKYKKDEVLNSYKKIMKKIHPDVSPELSRLASIVNEAKDKVIKDIG